MGAIVSRAATGRCAALDDARCAPALRTAKHGTVLQPLTHAQRPTSMSPGCRPLYVPPVPRLRRSRPSSERSNDSAASMPSVPPWMMLLLFCLVLLMWMWMWMWAHACEREERPLP